MPTTVNFQKLTSLWLLECGLWRYLMPTSVDSGGNIMPTSSNSRDTLHAYKCAQGTSLMPASLDSGVTTCARALQRYKMSLH
jgi:hypothetical protein